MYNGNSTGFKYVTAKEHKGRDGSILMYYVARAYHNGGQHYIGCYSTPEDAHAAALAWLKKRDTVLPQFARVRTRPMPESMQNIAHAIEGVLRTT